MPMFTPRIVAAALIAATLAGCDKPAPPAPEARPVRTVTVERGASGETVSLTGQVRAKDQVNLAFRLDGRMIERPVNVGDVLTAGQVVARLDPQNQQNALRSAEANLASAEAALTQARLTFGRQQELLKDGWTTRAQFDEAQQALQAAQAQVDSAQAQLRIAQDQLSYTVLSADAPGAVTAVGAEPGEVVRAGQMIVQLARQGGRDAVFDVPEQLIRTGPRDPLVELALTNDPTGDGHRPRAGSGAPGRCRHPDVPGQGRHYQSTGRHAAGLHCHRPHQAVRASRRGGSGERAHRGERTPGRVGGRPAEPDRVAAQRGRRCATTRRASSSRRGWKRARSWSPPACRRCGRARRSACWEPPHEALQPLRMGDPAPFARDLFHARHRGRGHRVLPPARAERGSGLHDQDHGGAGRVARAPPSATRSSRSPTASSASSRRRRTSIT